MEFIDPSISPQQILSNPLINKGTAFTQEERDSLRLNGFLPSRIASLEEQVQLRYQNFIQKTDEISRYAFLSNLQNRNEVLFYRLVLEHVSEMLPLIYTPTIGDVSLDFSSLYHQHRGIYFSYPLKDRISEIVSCIPNREVDVIVVTDGERILGLGDVGIGGMAIPQGKLALYTLFGGIHPSCTLPVMLDVGTNNEELLNNPSYLGWRHKRIVGKEYEDFIDQFVQAIKKRYPHVLLQWEDFAKPHARPLLEKYRDQICSFNDDIQGTAAVTLAATLSAVKAIGEKLSDQKIAVLGGGSAGLGIANLIVAAMQMEGLTESQARKKFYVVDINGLIHDQLSGLDSEQKKFAQDSREIGKWKVKNPKQISLLETIQNVHPNILIGVSTQHGVFTEEIVKTMAQLTPRPIIFPLSNPTSRSEAEANDLIKWTNGKAIVATGSPFDPVMHQGKKHQIGQCNNVFIFPGLGLGIVVSKTPKVTEKMFIRTAQVLSEFSPLLKDPLASLFPPLEQLRDASRSIAIAVVQVAQEEGLVPKASLQEIEKMVSQKMWFPTYPNYSRAS
jgi:malate dehydrogenase (oxaloacetate-decarboxylating)